MQSKTTRKPNQNIWGDDHPEKLADSPKPFGFTQQLKGIIDPASMLDSVFGTKTAAEYPRNYSKKERPAKPRHETLVFSYKDTKQEKQLKDEIKMLHEQLQKSVDQLNKSEKSLTSELAKVKVEQLPAKTGIYYLRYIEWLITLVKQLRMKVDEGRTWLTTFTARQKKRLGYWQKYKKHGTTFGLSHERTLATQSG